MSYFKMFPVIEYDDKVVKDILRRVVYNNKSDATIYEYIILRDGEKPEDISFRYYGSSFYHWVVMIVNDVIHPFYDWLMSDSELSQHITNAYGIGHENDVHHYETNEDAEPEYVAGTWVDSSFPLALRNAVTNREYEVAKNETKRRIRILKPQFVKQLENEFKNRIRKSS